MHLSTERMSRWLQTAAFLAAALMFNPSAAANDGEAIYDKTCLLCHGLISEPTAQYVPDARDGQPVRLAVMTPRGPTLNGIVGRPVATVAKYAYSKAMRKFGATGAVWDRETLDRFLTDSRKMVKGYMIVKLKQDERKLVLDYLEKVAKYQGPVAYNTVPDTRVIGTALVAGSHR